MKNKSMSENSFILNIFLMVGGLECNMLHKFFKSGTGETNRNERKCWHTLRE